jgi:TfoX/Sxy family transcriptional regulator of competence genes
MPYDEGVAQRIREIMNSVSGLSEKKMFGGIAFMVNGNMCVGVVKHELMLRVGPDQYDEVLNLPYVRKMDFTGRPMRGLVYVESDGFGEDKEIKYWIERALLFVRTLPEK